jgi:starch synthase
LAPLPALITSGDLLPGGGPLNGRRWAGQLLLQCWAQASADRPMALAHAQPSSLVGLLPQLRAHGFQGDLHGLGLVDPAPIAAWGGLFLPDPSIGRWAQWRRRAGPASFSLIGQIHTLSTAAAFSHLQDLASEPVEPWDAVICSSTAGRDVVLAVLEARHEELRRRVAPGAPTSQPRWPQLPVIPLPLPVEQMQRQLPPRAEARRALKLPADTAVVLWLGRLSVLTKLDPWPSYVVLQRVAEQLERPLVLLECGPDDPDPHPAGLQRLRQLCPGLTFMRLGGAEPVAEDVKYQALAAADLALSLVDNTQETFGLAVAEAMAAGLPVVASNWDGYRDLVSHGVDGYLVPSRWGASAAELSPALGWQQFTGLQSYPAIAGALAQLVQVDLRAAEAALLALLQNPALAGVMGRAARNSAEQRFALEVVMAQYEALFGELEQRRAAADPALRRPQAVSLQIDPVRAFAGYASEPPQVARPAAQDTLTQLPVELREERQPLWQLLMESSPEESHAELRGDLLLKHL